MTFGDRVGVGLGYRREIGADIIAKLPLFDLLEVMTESLFNEGSPERHLRSRVDVPIVCHGVDMSLGTDDELDAIYLAKAGAAVRDSGAIWFSDHVAMTQVAGVDLGHLSPVITSEHMLDVMIGHVRTVQQAISTIPFIVENIAYLFPLHAGLNEVDFISRLVREADCGLLLDLNNLYANSINHRYDCFEFLDALPLDRIVEVHIAGGRFFDDLFIDTHAHTVSRDVWRLLDEVCRKSAVRAVILERDDNLDSVEDIFEEVAHARAIWRRRIGDANPNGISTPNVRGRLGSI